MNKIVSCFDLNAWKYGHTLVLEVYKITNNFPRDELFGVTSQLRRSATSITANIAEGFGRYHYKDKTRFYYQSRGSAFETQNFLIVAKDLGYLDKKVCDELISRYTELIKIVNGLIRRVSMRNNSISP